MVYVVSEPICPEEIYPRITKRTAGSVLLHYAVVKETPHNEAATRGVVYCRNGDMEAEMAGIIEQLKSRWKLEDVLLIRRLGCLKTGEIISLIGVSSPNSADAFAACQHGIVLLKKMTTFVKKEKCGE
jgi:molybdopterin synthase catalytic subunit